MIENACSPRSQMKPRKILLVLSDAADWKVIHPLMDAGEMPNVRKFVEKGRIASLHPPL
jgi:predicted AlkP superfamily phosphohydrolase/phosphomutase